AQRTGREVCAGDDRALPGPGQRVEAEVALEVKQRLPDHRADLVDLVRAELRAPGLELLDRVELRTRVDLSPLVPQGAVGCDIRVVHDAAQNRRTNRKRTRLHPGRQADFGEVGSDVP